mmetsp:Transcript_42658/g.91503  ORF Transcript_42658/g.91503 Transcript_42658/m.91503 type:complete len:382 (+) Transcript_42658:194-1339(+)|eukprot:CAMPEP_0206435202 /NCGR_PEP_ID=MMETSP0324_2-20121206/9689_1 /ASSEMBLY_ACC=CAM_ASM_000836 /TAXON_ID=2866 /ORGANISM="Crypthecodinium cohnii, Strain Seligo" /LENGTH=381 /DNA_ID=CAMNT_0053902015 /DNA_START=109 /DNA_END=1254 /DNA_ORIENTATION=-
MAASNIIRIGLWSVAVLTSTGVELLPDACPSPELAILGKSGVEASQDQILLQRGSTLKQKKELAAAEVEQQQQAAEQEKEKEEVQQQQLVEEQAEEKQEEHQLQQQRHEVQVQDQDSAGTSQEEQKETDADTYSVTAFFWNVHWQCSNAARGAKWTCKDKAKSKFVELAKQEQASIVGSVELSHGMSTPVQLNDAGGLEGWTQINGPCKWGDHGDSAALAFAPGWEVQDSHGGCLRWDADTRAFAVAKVKPPTEVRGCPLLCVIAVHAPHSSINRGGDDVSRVCGDAREQCTIAFGDWNKPAYDIYGLWSSLVGGTAPHFSVPNERSCCFPESDHYGIFDHLATNIPNAAHDSWNLFPYQILEENPVQEHRPLAVKIHLPL